MKRIGLLVNPVAGLGGRVGLKGSDGVEIQRRALQLGAVPEAWQRAAATLACLASSSTPIEWVCAPSVMGEHAARQAGFSPQVVGRIQPAVTTARDTTRLARQMTRLGLDLLLFAGGDGTARDICSAVPAGFPCLGIPAGVKIQSAVFATSPRHAGELVEQFLSDHAPLREAEVVDLDETAYRDGRLGTRLYGYLSVPFRPRLVQNQKVPSPAAESVQAEAIAADIIASMQPGMAYILGPGTTTRAIARALHMEKTLIGVDVLRDGTLIARDVCQAQLLEITAANPTGIIVSPVGGQGFLFGRGNQQIGAQVIRRVGRENIIIACTLDKLHQLRSRPFFVDTGDPEVDAMLSGYITVITGYRERAVCRIVC